MEVGSLGKPHESGYRGSRCRTAFCDPASHVPLLPQRGYVGVLEGDTCKDRKSTSKACRSLMRAPDDSIAQVINRKH